MATRWRRVFIVGGSFIALFLAFLIGVRFWITSDHARNLIQARLNTMIPGHLSWDEFHLSLLAGTFELTDIKLETPSGGTPAAVERFLLDLSWASLLKGEVAAKTILVRKPRIKLMVDARGNLELMEALPPPGEKETAPSTARGLPFNVRIDSFQLTEGSFLYEKAGKDHPEKEPTENKSADKERPERPPSDKERPEKTPSEKNRPDNKLPEKNRLGISETVAIRNLSVTVENANLRERSADFSVVGERGMIRAAGMETAVRRILFRGSLSQGKLDPLLLEIKSEMVDAGLTGTVGNLLAGPDLDLDLDLAFSLPGIRDAFHLEPEMTGPVKLHMEVCGPMGDPEGRLSVEYAGGRIAGNEVERAALSLGIGERVISIEEMIVKAAQGRLGIEGLMDLSNAFPRGFLSPERDPDAIAWQFRLRQEAFSPEAFSGGQAGFSGKVDASLSMEGRGVTPSSVSAKGELTLSATGVAVEDLLSPMDITLGTEAAFSNNRLSIPRFTLISGNNRISVKGACDIAGEKLAAELSAELPDIAALGLSPRLGEPGGKIALSAVAHGPRNKPGLDLRLKGERLAFRDVFFGNLSLSAALGESGTVEITNLLLENGGSLVRATGSVGIFDKGFRVKPDPETDLSIRFENLDAGNFTEEKILSGTVDGSLSLGGTPKDPRGKLSVKGRNMGFRETRAGDVDAELGLAGGTVYLDRLRLRNGRSALDISGTAGVLDGETGRIRKVPSLDLSVGGDGILLEDFHPRMKGKIRLEGRVRGDTEHPQGKFSIRGNRLDLGGRKIRGLRMDSRLDGERIDLETLRLSFAPGREITAKGTIHPLGRHYDLSVRSKGILLEHIAGLGEAFPAQGELSFALSGTGSFDDPRMAGELTIRDLVVRGEAVEDIRVGVELADRVAKISGRLVCDTEARLNLDTREFEAAAAFDGTDLSPFFRMAGRDDLAGILTGTVSASGNLDAPDRLRADARFPRLEIHQDRIGSVRGENIEVFAGDREITLPGARLTLQGGGELLLKGRAGLDGPVDFTAEGTLPVAAAALFAPAIREPEGDIRISAAASGTLEKPDIRAEIGLAAVGFEIPGLTQKLHGLNGRLGLTPDSLSFDGVGGRVDSGEFGISGRVDLENFRPTGVNLAVNAHALPVTVPETAELLFNSELIVGGTPDKSTVKGELTILEGRYFRDMELKLMEMAKEKKREEKPLPRKDALPLLENTELAIAVKHRNPFVVENNLALMNLAPDLRLRGTLARPLVSGRAEVREGTLFFQNKEFEIKKGIVDFVNPYRIEPSVDIAGDLSVRRWLISLGVSGTPDNLDFRLTSVPEESDGDILSLLAFGRTSRELIGGEGGSTRSTGQILAAMVSDTLQEGVKDAVGLDEVGIQYGEGTEGGKEGDIRVTLGKELSRRLKVKYGVERRGKLTVQQGMTEYKILENLLIKAFNDTEGDFGGELLFRLEFR